jgi:type IV pilus assembly protein PilM
LAFSIQHFFRPALLLGLDIDPTAIRMVELSQGPDQRFKLERHAQLALPEGIVSDHHIEHPGRLGEHIATLAQQLGSKRKHVALALPAHAVVTRRMQVPADSTEQAINKQITEEASAYLTVTPDQVRVDYQINHADADTDDSAQRNIVLAAARREQLEDRIAAVEAAGLIAEVIDIDLYAAHAACVQGSDVPPFCALLMLGTSMMQIALFDRHQLLYRRELPDCGIGLSDESDVGYRNDDSGHNAQIAKIAISAARAMQLATPAGVALAHIFVGGDRIAQMQTVQVKHLTQAIQAQSNIACSAAHPFAAMQTGGATNAAMMIEVPGVASYLVACGLAMRRTVRGAGA